MSFLYQDFYGRSACYEINFANTPLSANQTDQYLKLGDLPGELRWLGGRIVRTEDVNASFYIQGIIQTWEKIDNEWIKIYNPITDQWDPTDAEHNQVHTPADFVYVDGSASDYIYIKYTTSGTGINSGKLLFFTDYCSQYI